ncbi:MAG: transporter [Mesorhizobium sp.]|jgi:hypothetical protein
MPSADDIQQFLSAAFRLMIGRKDAIRQFDLSADGFWNSFFAIVVALPALAVIWVTAANDLSQLPEMTASRLSLFLRLAVADLGAWVLPIGGMALAARPIGIADRFVHYVVASNWGTAVIAWLMLPASLLNMLAPAAWREIASAVSLGFFALSLVLGWRLTNGALGKGPALASAVFVGMFAASLVVVLLFQYLLGVPTL